MYVLFARMPASLKGMLEYYFMVVIVVLYKVVVNRRSSIYSVSLVAGNPEKSTVYFQSFENMLEKLLFFSLS